MFEYYFSNIWKIKMQKDLNNDKKSLETCENVGKE